MSIQSGDLRGMAEIPAPEEAERVFQWLPVAVFTVDCEGRITSWNEKARQVTGYKADEVIGRNASFFYGLKGGVLPSPRDVDYVMSPAETLIRRKDGQIRSISRKASLLRDSGGTVVGGVEVFEDITDRKQANVELLKIQTALNDATDAIIITDLSGTVTYVNMAFGTMFKHNVESINECGIHAIFLDQAKAREVLQTIIQEEGWSGEVEMVSSRHRIFPAFLRATPIWSDEIEEGPIGVLLIVNDVTDRKGLESQLLQAQKLKAIGQLAAGIAHEINTPMQYVGDNARFLKDSFQDLIRLMGKFSRLLSAVNQNAVDASLVDEVTEAVETSEMDYLSKEIPTAIQETLEGIRRVSEIVRAMKEFSHPDGQEKVETSINDAIQNTITVARNEWKYVAEMETDLDPNLPLVPCLRGELNQVILNILVNAAQAVAEKVGDGSKQKGKITVRTRRDGNRAEIRISDTGNGIPKDVQPRIFDPFFTTKDVGKGTGQGLTISHSVVVEKHKGSIAFETEEGKGTTFIIRLPLKA